MNEPTTTKKSEFVFRRLSDSFDQFTGDLWGAVPLWLLALVVLLIAARVVYRYANPAARAAGAKDAGAYWLKTAMWLSVLTLVGWVLVAFYTRDAEPTKGATEAVTALGPANVASWYTFTIGLFVLGCVFVALMYVKDTKSVRWYWAAPLALLRMSVYAILCFVFLLPARQSWEETNRQSRVVILLDITPSMNETDELTARGNKPKTRIDVIIDFLTDTDVAFLKNLLDKNPVAVYAFGARLDESAEMIERGGPGWSKAEWQAFAKYDFRPHVLRGLTDEGKEQLKKRSEWEAANAGTSDWAASLAARREEPALQTAFGLSEPADADRLRKNLERLDKRIEVARTILSGTNVPDSVMAAVSRESSNMVQGIIVFSDGRSNLGTDTAYTDLRDRAGREKIPIFTIGVGEDRQTAAVAITDVQAPDSAPIDEAWKIIVEADGVNLANKEVEVELHLFKPGSDIKLLDLDGRPKGDHKLTEKLVFAPGDPPHGQAEFVIDPAKLPEHLTTESKDAAIKKRVLLEGKWGAVAVIAKHPEEAATDPFHIRARPDINVVQQKLRVLLVAGAPSREFSFLRTLLVREVQDKRASLTTLVQNEAGTSGKLTPELDETVLLRFPDRFDLGNKKVDPAEKPYNLNEYDVILAFDADWTELSQQQCEDLGRWVREGGGGLIYVAGPINTFQLARVEPNSRLTPFLDVLPVVPADIVAQRIKAIPKTPRRLYLHPERILGSDLLKLDDKVADDPKAGWERFFTDRDKYTPDPDLKKEQNPERGFFSCYPIQALKPGCAVLADFVDVGDAGETVLQPWIVTNNPSAAYRTAFLASGELHKMRAFEPSEGTGREYFERAWMKLIKYMAAKRNVKAPRGRVLVSREAVSGTPLRVQARVLNESAKPFEPGRGLDPKFKIIREAPNGEKREFGPFALAPKQSAAGAFDGYYAGQELLNPKDYPPGEYVYRVAVDVPESSGETLTGEFRIRQSNPEKDNWKPDYAALLRMASDFDKDLRARVPEKVQVDLDKALPKEAGMPRLAFKITDRESLKLIPECMQTKTENRQNRGPVEDLWDKGVTFPTYDEEMAPESRKYLVSWWSGQRLSVVLLAVVFLLSLEWLVRKLLRLA